MLRIRDKMVCVEIIKKSALAGTFADSSGTLFEPGSLPRKGSMIVRTTPPRHWMDYHRVKNKRGFKKLWIGFRFEEKVVWASS